MRVLVVAALIGLAACAPHEREESLLFSAPAAEAMPDAPVATRPLPRDEPDPGCEPDVADAPTPLFGESMLIRPPRNVELLEQNPTFASTMTQSGTVVTCDASLRRMTLMLFQNDPNKSLDVFAREFVEALEKNGYVGARDIQWEAPSERVRRGAVAIPALDAQPAAELFVQLKRSHAVVTTVVFEAPPGDFDRLRPTFEASADSLLVVPPQVRRSEARE